MTADTKDILSSILDKLSRIDYIKPADLPEIPLYMDQVTTFMDSQLAASKRHEDDKILTKTMINNYAKNDLIPPPLKKKYSKEHLLLLIFVYYFKNIMSISDIQTLMAPITEKYFSSDKSLNLTKIYKEVFSLERGQIDRMVKEIIRQYNIAQDTFESGDNQDKEYLHQFAFICMLSFDVYLKKQIIEQLIDQMAEKQAKKDPSPKKKK